MCYGSLPSVPLLTGLLLRIYQDLRQVSFPLGEGHRDSSESIKSGTMDMGRWAWTFPAVSYPAKATQSAYSTSITSCATNARRGGAALRLHFTGKSIPFQVQYCGGCEAPTLPLLYASSYRMLP